MWVQWTFFQTIIAMETSSLLLGPRCTLYSVFDFVSNLGEYNVFWDLVKTEMCLLLGLMS